MHMNDISSSSVIYVPGMGSRAPMMGLPGAANMSPDSKDPVRSLAMKMIAWQADPGWNSLIPKASTKYPAQGSIKQGVMPENAPENPAVYSFNQGEYKVNPRFKGIDPMMRDSNDPPDAFPKIASSASGMGL